MGTSWRYKYLPNQTKTHPYLISKLINAACYVYIQCYVHVGTKTKSTYNYYYQSNTKMQTASISCYLACSSPNFPKAPLLFPTKHHHQSILQISSTNSISVKAAASSSSDEAPQVDYNSMASSVFPAEACETVGGVACDVEMFPETKLIKQDDQSSKPKESVTVVDREYLDYNSPKTVFISEACDDLGGEFCDPDYQTEQLTT